MTERARFVLAHQRGLYSMTELCARFGVSRKTGYKWLGRFEEGGLDGLSDRSRAPKTCSHQTAPELEALVVACRRQHPRWGPRKLLAYLTRRHPELDLPAGSTAGAILKRTHQRIAPGRPQQNGRHERMHRDLKAETTRPPERNRQRQQERFDGFREEFNEEHPHEALGGDTPAARYRRSERAMPPTLPEPESPAYWEKRWVSKCGTYKWKRHQLFISQALGHKWIAFEETDDGVWSVYFYDVLLARLDERDLKLRAAVP